MASSVKLNSRIPEYVVHVDATCRSGVKRTADRIASTMRAIAPKDTGRMAASITSVSLAIGKSAGVTIDVPSGDEDQPMGYWIYPNYGTRYQAAQAFVERAVEAHVGDLPEEISVGMNEL